VEEQFLIVFQNKTMKKILLLLLLPFTLLAQKEVIVHITTDAWPNETRWVLHADSLYGNILGDVDFGHYTQQNTSYTDTLYISDSLINISFVIYDAYGDGIQAPGSYFVSICGDTIISYANPSFTTALASNRIIPPCNGPPVGVCVEAILNINLDQFQGETTWEIHDSTGSLLYAGGPYSQAPDYQPQFEPVCLPIGNISFTIYDSYGDGLAGALWGGNNGSYYVMQCGDTLVYGTVANFGTDSTHVFTSDTCIPPPPIPGCMDEDYLEFNPAATVNDSSCATLKILGCTDSTMFNYSSTANTMDYIDSCYYTLTLYDYQGNGWVGSALNVYQGDDTLTYALLYGYTETFYLMLSAPELVRVELIVDPQAVGTVIECGFSLVSSSGDTTIYVPGGFSLSGPLLAFFPYTGITNCGTECEPVVTGCIDSVASNYSDSANVAATCYYNPGCMFPAYLEYYTQGFVADIDDFSCDSVALFGCTDSTMFNYDSLANVSVGCLPKIYGCMQPLAFNYNPLANTPDTCMPLVYGCTDPTMYNYCLTCNTSNGDCDPYVFGCTDSIMFNYNPLANADNSSCVLFIYGCTDPSMLNYNALANTEDFTCIPFIYGCMDSTALNYDPLANTDNESCITAVEGCMDQSAYNYNSLANVSDSLSCLFDAGCVTGPGNPYWLNDPCYAWVIDVDDYCCNNTWDGDCQSLYNYCEDGWTGPTLLHEFRNQLIVYPNPVIDKININKNVDINVFNYIGGMVISETNINVLDVSILSPGVYTLQITYNNKLITKKIIKK